jgi:Glycosyltransferase Family 4
MPQVVHRKPLRILITNNSLAWRGGSELYVRDLATWLLRRGHAPIVYSTNLGESAEELRRRTVPVVNDLDLISNPPELIHGQHHIETMTALLRFPSVPAIYFCHGWLPWEERPPRFPRILRYVAVDDTCRDRLVYEHGIPENIVRVILNSVDLEIFESREPLPAKPRRALVFSNYMTETTGIGAVREACSLAGIELDVIGNGSGKVASNPEELLVRYDIVFAKGRCALEALAVGSAVVPCDRAGVGPMVTTANLDEFRRLNFGIRVLQQDLSADVLSREIARYDSKDATEVSLRIRETAGIDSSADQILALYTEVLEEYSQAGGRDLEAEGRDGAAYLRWLGGEVKDLRLSRNEPVYNTSLIRRSFNRASRLLARLQKGVENQAK